MTETRKSPFVWGAATSAFQIEGGAAKDGRADSVWDVFCRSEGRIFEGGNAETACRSYERFEEDVRLLKGLHVQAYRFSVSWPRVLPQGVGEINEKGVQYYRALVQALRENGIEPYVTLYHWDLPQALSLRGGLLNRDFAEWFAEYAAVVAEALGEGVQTYFTFNEPESIVGAGYALGAFAPGWAMGNDGAFPAQHNLLRAHGAACRVLRSLGKRVGIVASGEAPYPAQESEELVEACRTRVFSAEKVWSMSNTFDPIFLGDYPADFYRLHADAAKEYIRPGDLNAIAQPTDYCCQNHYNGFMLERAEGGVREAKRAPGYARMATGWPIDEKGLYWTMRFLYERYKKPVMITENGMSGLDIVSADGGVHDAPRIEYYRRYLGEVDRILRDGIDLRGYFAWSLLDNFEWASGYSQRFGLVYVDFETGQRIPKDSYAWYAEYIAGKTGKGETECAEG